MTTTARRSACSALLAVVVLALSLLLAVPASAADVEVRLTADGPVPADVALPPGGGTVLFVVDDALSHTLVSDAFSEQRLGGLGQPRQVELEFRSAGAVAFTDRRNRPVAPEEEPGTVTVAAPATAEPSPAAQAPQPPPPSPASTRTPVAVRTPGSSQSGATPEPLPPRSLVDDVIGQPLPLAAAPLPAGAVDPAAAPAPPSSPEPITAAAALPPVQAIRGQLPGERTSRPLGLPVALAALAALGVASLIVRVLLAEPAARRR